MSQWCWHSFCAVGFAFLYMELIWSRFCHRSKLEQTGEGQTWSPRPPGSGIWGRGWGFTKAWWKCCLSVAFEDHCSEWGRESTCKIPLLPTMTKSHAKPHARPLYWWLEIIWKMVYLNQPWRKANSCSHMQKTCLTHFKDTMHVLTTEGKNSEKKAINKSGGWVTCSAFLITLLKGRAFLPLFSFADLQQIKLLTWFF